MEKRYIFHVNGMHCKSCVIVTESELKKIPNIIDARSSLDKHHVELIGDFNDKAPDKIAQDLSEVLKKHGYSLSVDREIRKVKWSEFKIALPAALLFIGLFVLLQKAGLVNLVGGGTVTYGTSFVIGIIASLSTCMAVVGGLLLSMSATFSKKGEGSRPQIMFHIGRLVSFFIFGGVIGALGSVFTLTTSATFLLNVILGLVMLILGINLLDIFHSTKKFQVATPKFIAKYAFEVSEFKHTLTPLLVGIATFFLPCGFTQSMQVYTLSTGSFIKGALTMSSFALGTFPVLALISFGSLSIHNNPESGIFFKAAGIIVILFALFNLINSLVVINVINPVFNF